MEKIQTSVDFIAHKSLRLLNKLINLAVVLGNNDSVLGGVLHLGNHDSALLSVCLVVLNQLMQRVFANNVGIEHHEEARLVVCSDVLLSEADGACSSHRLVFNRDSDLKFVLFLEFLKSTLNYFCLEANSENNLSDASTGESLNLVTKNWEIAEVDQGLGHGESHRAKACSEAADKDECFHSKIGRAHV